MTARLGVILGLCFVVTGGLLMWWPGTSEWKSNGQVQAYLGQFGGLLVATGLLAVAWDLFGRRALADEVLAKAGLSADIARAESFGSLISTCPRLSGRLCKEFQSLAVPGGATLEVWLHAGDAVFSCYRFDSKAVLTLYSHGQERRTQVPTFVMDGGELFEFVYNELEPIAARSKPAPEEQTE